MRRFLCLLTACLVWAACGEKSLQVSTPTPAPRPAPATAQPPAVVAAAPAPVAPSPAPEFDTEPVEEPEVLPEPISDEASLARRLEAIEIEALERSLAASDLQSPDLPALAADDGSLLDEIEAEAIPEDYDLELDRETILRNTESELPLVLNDRVARMINYFSGRGAKTFRLGMGRAGAYRETIERILEEENVPAEILHLAQAESGFRPKARSYAAATGMWQFMAFRGKQYGLRQDRYLEERYDFESATRAAARHLKDLEIEFGDWYLAMAAYHSGPGGVTRAIKRGGTRDYFELCRRKLLGRRGCDYVPIILAMTYVGKHPELYDVGTIDPAPTLRYDTVEVEDQISTELIADITGTTATEIEQLNQALLRSATPPYRYSLRLPPGTADRFKAELATVPSDKRLSWRRHEVGEGESLTAIAGKYQVSSQELLAVNGLNPDALSFEPGMRLNVPTSTKLRLFRSTSRGSGGLVEDGTGRYKIARGDNLGAIARRFGVSVGDLRSWNGLTSSAIRAGRYLIVRPEGVGAPAASAPDGQYKVARGDTLGKIAARFRTSVRQLQAWNGLSSSRIHVGDMLRVPGSNPTAAVMSKPTPGGAYRIRRGDSLGSIARRHGVTIADLQQWNGLRGNSIRAGDNLHVSAPSAAAAAAAVSEPESAAGPAEIRYRIRSGDSLATIASRHDVSINELRAWNNISGSRIRAGATLIIRNQRAAASSTPARAAAPVATTPRAPAQAPSVPAPSDGRYKIRPGDNLGAIAETFGVRASDLRRWNNMRGSRIRAGHYLIVRPPSAAPARPQPQPTSAAAVAPAPAKPKPGNPGTYTVRSGDTLGAIATRYGVTVSNLRAWNGIRGSRLSIGQKLITSASTASNTAGSGTYKVRSGDTLAVIASRFNVSVKELMTWNGLKSTRIRAGALLRVRSDAGGDD